ncbi:MAG TPA: hypothetical protein VJ944_00815 [Thermoplasmataceae archaeon]|nr:hypothetical protein [Thermoplasmataceae archaeon]
MSTRIPTRFFLRYWILGTFVLILFVLLMLSSEAYFYVPLLDRAGFLLFMSFAISFLVYVYFELTNIRDAAVSEYPYYYDYNGIYRANNLIADWTEVKKVSFKRVAFTETITADYTEYPRSGLMTRQPLNNVMHNVNVSEIKVRKRLSVVEIHKSSASKFRPDIVIDMSPKRFLINRTCMKMKRYVEMRAANVEFDVDIDIDEGGSSEDSESSMQTTE